MAHNRRGVPGIFKSLMAGRHAVHARTSLVALPRRGETESIGYPRKSLCVLLFAQGRIISSMARHPETVIFASTP